MNLGKTIKNIRCKKELNQVDLAAKCQITQTYLSQIESNIKEPSIPLLKTISCELEIPLPIIFFLSMDENDVKLEKKKAFETISGPLKSLINDLFH